MAVFFCNSFSAGMNEVINPTLLNPQTAALLINADITSGKLKSIKSPYKLSANDPEDLNHFGNINRSVVKLYERTYWSQNDAIEAPYYGGDQENFLGVPYPDYSKNVVFTKVEGTLTGDYKYCVVFVSSNGWESAPGSITDYEREISLASQSVKITVSWDSDVVSYAKIYRTADHGADFYLAGEVHNSGGSITDNMDDNSLVNKESLTSIDNYPPPEGGKYLCEFGGIFFLAVGSTLWFSAQGNPHAWPLLNFVGFDDIITGIAPEFQGVLVYTLNNTYRITGAENLETVTKVLLPGNQGCVKYNTIAQVSNSPVWLSNDGICLWNGESINVISKQIINTTRLQAVCSVSANDCYYLFLEDGAIVFDHRHGDVFLRLGFSCNYSWYDAPNDALYLQRSDGIYEYGRGSLAQYQYKSGYIGVPESQYIYLQELDLYIDGEANVKLCTDEKTVFEIDLPVSGRYRLKAPYNTLARYAQIVITGYGELKEITLFYG